jgi:hypothetical protein
MVRLAQGIRRPCIARRLPRQIYPLRYLVHLQGFICHPIQQTVFERGLIEAAPLQPLRPSLL